MPSTAVRERVVRLRQVLGFPPRPAASVGSRAVVARLRVADALGESQQAATAAVLYAEALRVTSSAGRKLEDDGVRLGEALDGLRLDPLYFETLPPAELLTVRDALRRRAHDAARELAPLGPVRNRRAWLTLATLSVLVVAVALVLWFQPFAARNLALGKTVKASSMSAGSSPAALVDGERGNYKSPGALTAGNSDGWMTVDLGQGENLHRIVVCNRGDRNMDDSLPVVLSISDDGEAFHDVATRTQHFGDGSFASPPWAVKLHGRARYVRVRGHGFLGLSELEIY